MKRPILKLLVVLMAVQFAIIGCARQRSPTINIGVRTANDHAPFYLADKLGFYADQGMDVQVHLVPSNTEIIEAIQRVADGLMRGLKADGVNIHQANGAAAGQIVPHVHFHVIPRFADDGHHWNWAARKYSDMDEMAHVAATIRDAIPR